MSESKSNLWDRLTKECSSCDHATSAARQVSVYPGSANIFLTAQPVCADGVPFGERVRVALVEAHCRVCGDKRRVMSEEGKQLVAILESFGIITGAELERRLGAAKEGGQADVT